MVIRIISINRGKNPKGFPRWPNYLVKERILPAKRLNPTEKPLGFGAYPKLLKRYSYSLFLRYL
jgi:hypothetical protein